MRHYLIQLVVALDNLLNAVCGGWADQSMSAHLYTLRRDNKFWGNLEAPVDAVLGSGHCKHRWEVERDRKPVDLR